jgi:hypothetical protein
LGKFQNLILKKVPIPFWEIKLVPRLWRGRGSWLLGKATEYSQYSIYTIYETSELAINVLAPRIISTL